MLNHRHPQSLITKAGFLLAGVIATAFSVDADGLRAEYTATVRPFLETYCVECHGRDKHKGDINLHVLNDAKTVLSMRELWKDSAARVHGFDMPPAKHPKQPSHKERSAFQDWVNKLKYLNPKDPGRGTMRRLSQVEYANTLRDLLGADVAIASRIPVDTIGEGFNSSIPNLLMEKYLLVASDILDDAISLDQLDVTWPASRLDATINGKNQPGGTTDQERTMTGPSEVLATFTAPVAGTYKISFQALSEKTKSKAPPRLAIYIGRELISETPINATGKNPTVYSATGKIPPGRATLTLTLVNPYLESDETLQQDKDIDPKKDRGPEKTKPDDRLPRSVTVFKMSVKGPPAKPPTALQRKLFVATPSAKISPHDAARQIAKSFARRAFRRPATEQEIEKLIKVFRLSQDQGEVFSMSIKLMLKAILVSPQFLFLTPDNGKVEGKNGEIIPLGDHQLAQRLSYLLWSTMPDEELSQLADAGTLRDPKNLVAQTRRLLNDPRSRSLFIGFGAPWFHLDLVSDFSVDAKRFPELTPDLRSAMYSEGEMLFDFILRENRSMLEFVDCDYTFLNADLAKIYGITGIAHKDMRRVTLGDRNRGGMMTLPGVMLVTSAPSRTSPVKRGAWVLEQVLGQRQPPPPANVPAIDDKASSRENSGLNLRQRTERHRSDIACSGCHQAIDPIGFGLENFDVIGRWRTKDDTGYNVDSAGELPNKRSFETPSELKRIIADRRDEFTVGVVRKALAHTLCRALEGYDEVVVEKIAQAVAKDDYRFQTMWIEIVTSYPFAHRRISR